jgi:hypothetical protein
MERPQSHVTDTFGEAQMRAVFEPLGWVVNVIHSDYGVDFDVQMFERNQATGEWFKVQLKSSESTDYSTNGDFVSETLTAKHVAHYSTEITDPMFLIHADVKSKRTFWSALQLDAPITRNDPRTSITIRIDTRNELPATLPEMIAALRQIQIVLGARTVANCHVADFAKIVDYADQEQLIGNFQDKTDALRLKQIHDLATNGKLVDAKAKAEAIITNSESSVESKFSALLEEERAEIIGSIGAPQSSMSEIHVRTSKRMQQVTKNGPPALKLFSLIARKAGELDVLTFRDFGLHMNVVGHLRGGDPSIARQLAIVRLQSTHSIVKTYNQCIRLARCARNSKHRWALPLALLRVVQGIVMFTVRLRTDGQVGAAKNYKDSAMQLVRMAAWIAEQNEDDEGLSQTVTTAMLLTYENDKECDEVEEFARETLAKIGDRHQQQVTQEALDRAIKRMSGEKVQGDPENDLVRQIVENRATGLGIDMTNPDDPIVKLIRMGIRDANPERVIKHCEHAFLTIGGVVLLPIASLAQTLQLPSMQSKIIHCDLHDYAVEGATLDSACVEFKKKYCDTCKDIKPRPADWEYSDEWQSQENERHVEFVARFYQKHYET